MSEKKEFFKAYNLDMEYEFQTYKKVGLDYGDKNNAHLGRIFNFERNKRKEDNSEEKQYKFCNTYTEWKRHVNEVLAMQISNYDDLLHYLYLKRDRAEHLLEAVKCILIPLYIAAIEIFKAIADIYKGGNEVKIIYYVICLLMIAGASTTVLIDKMKKVEFMRDFISIAEEKLENNLPITSDGENEN